MSISVIYKEEELIITSRRHTLYVILVWHLILSLIIFKTYFSDICSFSFYHIRDVRRIRPYSVLDLVGLITSRNSSL